MSTATSGRLRRLPLVTPAALLFGVLGHIYAAWILVTGLDHMRSVTLSIVLFGLSVALVPAAVVQAGANGSLPVRRLYVLGALLVLIDVGNAVLIDPDQWSDTLLWCVGTGGVLLVVFALVAPYGHVLVITAAHALTLMVCLLVLPDGIADQAARAGLTVIDALVIPVLGGYGASVYRQALSQRAETMARTASTEQARDAGGAAEQLAVEELSWLTDQVAPLLQRVADGQTLSPAERASLDRSAIRLRRELTQRRERPGLTGALPRRATFDLEELDPDELGHLLRPQQRAALVGLLRLLVVDGRPGWAKAVITSESGRARVTIYAAGDAAEVLTGERARTLLDELGGPPAESVDEGVLVEFELPIAARS